MNAAHTAFDWFSHDPARRANTDQGRTLRNLMQGVLCAALLVGIAPADPPAPILHVPQGEDIPADAPRLRPGRGPFTAAAWIECGEGLAGDVLSQFDASTRRGWHVSVVTNAGCTSGQANDRQLQFGVDDGRPPGPPEDCGRPGEAVLVFSLCAFRGELFAGTCETGVAGRGRVFRYEGDRSWRDCGLADEANAVSALAEHAGRLFAATAHYRLRGSALPESENATPGGRIYRYEGEGRWSLGAPLPDVEAVNGLVSYRGQLYASSTYAPGVWRSTEGRAWEAIGTPGGRRVEALAAFDGALWGGGYDAAEVYRYAPEAGWRIATALADNTQTYGFGVFQGRLHVGTWPSGRVFRREADGRWTDTGRLGQEKEVMPLAYYQGSLWGGTLPAAEVHRFDGETWRLAAQLDATPEVTYRRVWSMAVHQGRLFCGTLPSGRVLALRAGRSATVDAPREAGWHHVAAVRDADHLRLYVDGRRAASERFDAGDLDFETDAPLRIGRGNYQPWPAGLADVRVYNQALDDDAIAELADRAAAPQGGAR